MNIGVIEVFMDIKIMDGFYNVESDGLNFWHWMNKNEALICLDNSEDVVNEVCLEFNALPSPGLENRNFSVSCDEFEINCMAPSTFRRTIVLGPNEKKTVHLFAKGEATHGENDLRDFILMIQNLRIFANQDGSLNLRKVQLVETDLLSRVLQICNKYDLHCYLFYGSLLGCVRNGGMIPWDDDVDIVLLRRDYDLLIQYMQGELEYPYYLQTPDNTTDAFFGGYSKLRNLDTTGIVIDSNMNRIKNQGIWIDIMPLDVIAEDKDLRNRQLTEIRKYQDAIKRNIVGHFNGKKHVKLLERLNYALALGTKDDTAHVAVLARFQEDERRRFYPVVLFNGQKYMKFEGLNINVPSDYRLCLQVEYGKNFEILPEEVARIPSHGAMYRVSTPCKEYMDHIVSPQDVMHRDIVLVSSINLLNIFFEKYSFISPEYIVCNEMAGQMYKGIMVLHLFELQSVMKDNSCVLIFHEDYVEQESKMKNIKIGEYKILVDEEVMRNCERKFLLSKVGE